MEFGTNSASAMHMPVAFVNVDKNTGVSMSSAVLKLKSGSEDQTNMLKRVNKSNNMKKRYRGKRKPKRKENRRRARPGRSRNGLPAIGAPCNNNEFLINQMHRDAIMGGKRTMRRRQMKGDMDYNDLEKEQTFCHHHHEGDNHIATSLEAMAERCGATYCEQDSTPCSTSSKRAESTSDYDSLYSPTESSTKGSSVCSNAGDDISDDESFDADFAIRNFEADYSAHQQEMKEQLIKLPRQQLEIRCSLLMDQLNDLEERSQMMTGRSRLKELEAELELLREENRRLRGVAVE